MHGLTLRATRHRFVQARRAHHTWCAFDSVGIPAALGLDAVARTDCPTCGRLLAVVIAGGTPVEAAGMVLWLPAAHGRAHLLAEFCATADVYCSRRHLEQRMDTTRTAGRATDLAGAAALGREAWADVAMIGLAPPGGDG